MFNQTGGGGKGIRPNQQQQHQQQQQQQQQHNQQQQQHHQSHHQTHNQTHHTHSSQQTQPQTSHHSHQQQPPQHSHHPHQLQQQQQHHHIHQPSHQTPYYSFQLSQPTATHLQQHHQQVQNNAVKTPSPPTQNTGGTPGATPSSSLSMGCANNGSSSSNTNLSRQHVASGNNLQHYTTHTASAAGAIMQPSSTAAFMTTTYLQQQFHQQSAAVMAAAAAAAQYNSVAGAAGHTQQTQNTNAAAQSLYQSQQQQHQQQQHHQTLHQTHHQPIINAHYYHPPAGAPTPTAAHMHPHHAHAQQHQLRGILTAPAHQRQPVYLTPANAIFALPTGPLQQQQQRSNLLTAHQQSGATGTPVSVTLQTAAAAARNAAGGPTAYITPPFCQPPLPMGATTLTQPPQMMTTAASIATPTLQAYGHMAAAAAAAAAANASTSSTSINTTENVKTRKYAIPIIDPITHENVMNPKPQKKSASVEAKPSAMVGMGEGEQQKPAMATTMTVTVAPDKYNESSVFVHTAEQKLMPTTSASKDKIDQQMQTDAIKDKSSNTKINYQANATKSESPSATISTASNLDEDEFDYDNMMSFRKQLPTDAVNVPSAHEFEHNEVEEEFIDEDEEHLTVFVEEVNTIAENTIGFDDYVEQSSGHVDDGDMDRDVYAEDMQQEEVESQMLQEQDKSEQELGQHQPELLTHELITNEYDTVSTNKLQAAAYALGEQREEEFELTIPKKLETNFQHQQQHLLKQPSTQPIQKSKANNNKQNTSDIAPTITAAITNKTLNKQAKSITTTSTSSTTSSVAKSTTATILKATPKLSPATSGTSSSTTSTPTHINMTTKSIMQQPQPQQQQQKQKTTVLSQVASTKTVVTHAAAAVAVNYNANTKKNRKGKKGAAAKENQKKLKQQMTTATIDTSNRSNSSSSSNFNNNNNSNTFNNNNTNNNNNYNNNNKSSLNNISLANNNVLLLTDINSVSLSNSNISEGTATTAVATNSEVNAATPFGFDTKQQQQQHQKFIESTNNNLGRGTSTTSIRSSTTEKEYICDTLADDSTPSSTRATSPVLQRKHIKTQEIVAQFLQPSASTKAKTPEELQLQFLNSSASACEDEEDLNARLQLQQQQEEAAANDLKFGDFNDDREQTHGAPITAAQVYKFSKGTTSHMGGKSNDTVDCITMQSAPTKSVAALKSFKLSGTTPKTRLTQQPPPPQPKNLKYSLEELRALAKCSEARKPPLVTCQKGACIAQLFVPRQQHHHTQHHHGLNMSPLALQQHLQQQYQHMSFNESIEFVTGKRRGGGGGQAKKHHDHQSVVSQAGGSGGAVATQQQRKTMDVIRVQLSLNEEIKLSECENAWQPETLRSHSSSRHSPAGSNDDIEAVLKKVRGVLNKLTPDNFDVLLKTMSSILMNTQEKMQQVMLLIFEKTISEPNFAPTYAKFCKVLFQEFKVDNKPQFSGSLIKRIQEEFESNVNDADAKKLKLQPLVDRLEACVDNKERIELQAELEDQEYQFRRRAWGTVRFIGEMYKLQSLTSDRVLICIESLLKHGCEEKLEYMCKLLTTVGHLLESKTAVDQTNSNNRMDKIFNKIKEFVSKSAVRTGPGGNRPVQFKISSRVRFMMQDVMDLRARSWDQVAQPPAQRRSSVYAKPEDKMAQCSGGSGGVVGGSSGGVMSSLYEKHSNAAASSGRLAYGGNQNNARQSRQTVSSSSHPNDSNYFMQKPLKFSTQQQQEQQQKQFIDLNKLKFSRGDDTTQSNTKLGNSSAYLWRTTGRQAAAATVASSNVPLPLNDTFNSAANKRQANQFQVLDKLDKLEQDVQQLPEAMSTFNSADEAAYAAVFTTKDTQKLLNRLIEEVLDTHSNSWHAEALSTWQSLNSKQQVALLYHLLTDYLHLASVKRPQRQACAKLFGYLMNDTQFDKQHVFAQAYAKFGEELPDILVDVPNGWTYVFEFLGPLLHARLLNFADIWLQDWSADAAFTERFLKAFINYFTQEFGANYAYELWHKVYKLEQGQRFFSGTGNSIDRCQNFLVDNKFQHIIERGAKGSQAEMPQPKRQGHSIAEQVQRIEYLLDTANDCDLAIDYINTNVYINTTFIRNLTRFFCCDYATVMSAAAVPSALSTPSPAVSMLLNAELFRSKCIPLLRFCIDANESFEISCLDEIVDSLLRCYDSDSQLANDLICSIFDMLYDCEIISKESFEKWYRGNSSDGIVGGGKVGVAAAVSEAAGQFRQQNQQHRLTNKIHAYMAKIL